MGDKTKAGDETEMAPVTLLYDCTSPPFSFLSEPPPLPLRGDNTGAASPLYQQRPHSQRMKMNQRRRSQPPRRAAEASGAAGDK